MKKYYLLSSFLHVVLVIFIALSNSGEGNGTGSNEPTDSDGKYSGNSDNKKIVPKNVEITIVTDPKKGASVKKQPTKKSAGIKDCKGKAWYGGIGVEHNYSDSSVTRVVPGYPAHNAGIKVGDVFVNLDTTTIIGEVGTNIHFTMKRTDGSYKMYNLIREKICIN